MSNTSSVFDMIGPVMIGPSSSHTAGVVRIARTVVRILGGIPETADIIFYNSFAQTYEGHGSDRAAVAGLLDFSTDDKRIKNSFDFAKKQSMQYSFKSVGNASTLHPNTIAINAKKGDEKLKLVGESRGGGVIRIKEINGFTANFSTNLHTLVVNAQDAKGAIGFLSNIISQDECNIATLTVSRMGKSDKACQIFEIDSELKKQTLDYISTISWVNSVKYIPVIDN